MTSAAAIIRGEIERNGPIPFERFMDLALYAPDAGYYTRSRDPFGAEGDFFTAEQLQPVFGALIARIAGAMAETLGTRTIIEIGAGRREMANSFAAFDYIPVDRGDPWPQASTAVVFSNELFDAMPVIWCAGSAAPGANAASARMTMASRSPAEQRSRRYKCSPISSTIIPAPASTLWWR